MRNFLRFIIALALWLIGGGALMLAGDIYMVNAHPDGLSYGRFLLREILFATPDLLLIYANVLLYMYIAKLTPYPKTTGVLLLAGTVNVIYSFISHPNANESPIIHWLGYLCAIMGAVLCFAKPPQELVAPSADNEAATALD